MTIARDRYGAHACGLVNSHPIRETARIYFDEAAEWFVVRTTDEPCAS